MLKQTVIGLLIAAAASPTFADWKTTELHDERVNKAIHVAYSEIKDSHGLVSGVGMSCHDEDFYFNIFTYQDDVHTAVEKHPRMGQFRFYETYKFNGIDLRYNTMENGNLKSIIHYKDQFLRHLSYADKFEYRVQESPKKWSRFVSANMKGFDAAAKHLAKECGLEKYLEAQQTSGIPEEYYNDPRNEHPNGF